jgi:HAD superfamily hydrolase (TIGR01509 family)
VTVRAIVFDFDGVIANSEPLHYRAFHDVLVEAGADLSERDYYDRYLGYDDVGVFKAVATDRGLTWDAEGIAALVARKAARIDVLERAMSMLFPGADAAVRRAAAAVPIAIASGALRAEIRKVLEREQLAKYFTAIVAAEDTPLSKPAPDPYLRAVALLSPALGGGAAAADVVAIEDSPWGLQSAKAAGLRTVAVAHTYAASTLDADLVIGSIGDLDIDRLKRL